MTPKKKRLVFNVLCNIMAGLLGVMITVDYINGNYGMVVADALIGIGCLILRVMAAMYLWESSPDTLPPEEQQLDKDDAA